MRASGSSKNPVAGQKTGLRIVTVRSDLAEF